MLLRYAYLINTRGIDREVVHTFAHKGMLYESAVYHDAVFVGFDKEGTDIMLFENRCG
ncbi:MAG: DUF3991 domain-containing protein [Ruminococcus sp.]|nr:DUF3991 domain-containing protein [Ruminococcus sp.]